MLEVRTNKERYSCLSCFEKTSDVKEVAISRECNSDNIIVFSLCEDCLKKLSSEFKQYASENLVTKKYTVIGYDKDNDVFVTYAQADVLADAMVTAKALKVMLEKDELKRENGEPIDWLEVYWDYNGPDEKMVWASYE